MNEPTPWAQQARELYKRFSLTLKSQTIDENSPGAILRDFQFVLNRIGE